MILIVSNKTDYTADYLILRLREREIEYVRLNTEDFPELVELSIHIGHTGVEGHIKVYDKTINLMDINSVWYRRPLPCVPSPQIIDEVARDFVVTESRETLHGLWRILPSFWVSHPDKIRIAESKLYQLVVASSVGFTTPQTILTNSPEGASSFYRDSDGGLIYKPLLFSKIDRGEKNNLLYTNLINETDAQQLNLVHYSPTLLQHHITKKHELRVTVVGQRVFAVEIHSQELLQARYDWRRANPLELSHIPCELPPNVASMCIRLVEMLGLAFGAIDLILTPENEYVFLEINPNGQWAWIEQIRPDVTIRDALIDLFLTRSM